MDKKYKCYHCKEVFTEKEWNDSTREFHIKETEKRDGIDIIEIQDW